MLECSIDEGNEYLWLGIYNLLRMVKTYVILKVYIFFCLVWLQTFENTMPLKVIYIPFDSAIMDPKIKDVTMIQT